MTCPVCGGPTIKSSFGYECTNKLYGRCEASMVVVRDQFGHPLCGNEEEDRLDDALGAAIIGVMSGEDPDIRPGLRRAIREIAEYELDDDPKE